MSCIASLKCGEQFLYRGVLCIKCNMRDTGLRTSKKFASSIWHAQKDAVGASEVIIANLSNGSLYRVSRYTSVTPVPLANVA